MSTIHGAVEKPEGFQEHHRQKRRSGDNSPANLMYVTPELHDWIEKNPAEAAKLGWWVSQDESPTDVPIVVPKSLPKEPRQKLKGKPRSRAVYSINVPKDAQENGVDLIEELCDTLRDAWREEHGWSEKVPDYYPIITALALAVQGVQGGKKKR